LASLDGRLGLVAPLLHWETLEDTKRDDPFSASSSSAPDGTDGAYQIEDKTSGDASRLSRLVSVYRDLLQNPRSTAAARGLGIRGTFYPDYLTVGGGRPRIFREALKYCRGKGIDVGAGLCRCPERLRLIFGEDLGHPEQSPMSLTVRWILSSVPIVWSITWSGNDSTRMDIEAESRWSCVPLSPSS